MSKIVMRQEWHELLFLHWEISSEQVQARLPEGLTVDTFEGKTYLGLVPFTMRNVRPVWSPPVPWLSHFHETNVRAYVRDKSGRAGVYFFSLEAANPIAVELARGLFKLPYHWAKMELAPGASYTSRRISHPPLPAHCHISYSLQHVLELRTAAPSTLEHFLIERYTLFSVSGKRLFAGRVAHLPYRFQKAMLHRIDQSLTHAAGFPIETPPSLAHWALPVKVDVFGLERV
ncbi:YqjF family protein [Armatimonas sp.]|uniref:YqjF family protein n=1 Tax=Armatimonas sp. TaxID=1872638 RepID=UPI0037510DC3